MVAFYISRISLVPFPTQIPNQVAKCEINDFDWGARHFGYLCDCCSRLVSERCFLPFVIFYSSLCFSLFFISVAWIYQAVRGLGTLLLTGLDCCSLQKPRPLCWPIAAGRANGPGPWPAIAVAWRVAGCCSLLCYACCPQLAAAANPNPC